MSTEKQIPEPFCKNCRLFNEKDGRCQVVILHEGERIRLPVDAEDLCFFENEFVGKDEKTFKMEVQEVRYWVEDPKTGEKTKDNGIVKIQYPEDFFGTENMNE